MERLGIEFISVFGLPPVPFAELAADLGCGAMSLGLATFDRNPHGYPAYSLHDPALQRDFRAVLRDRGVALSLLEGFFVVPGRDVDHYAADLDMAASLGAERVNTLGLDPDLPRCFDQFARLAELAAARGLGTSLEFVIGAPVGTLPVALDAARHVGRPDFQLMVDTMHVGRTGASAADLAAVEPALIGYAQLCDVPLVSEDWVHEAKFERRCPGDGELPLLDYLKALPRGLTIGLEIPLLRQAEAGVGPHERLGRCVAAARALLAQRDA